MIGRATTGCRPLPSQWRCHKAMKAWRQLVTLVPFLVIASNEASRRLAARAAGVRQGPSLERSPLQLLSFRRPRPASFSDRAMQLPLLGGFLDSDVFLSQGRHRAARPDTVSAGARYSERRGPTESAGARLRPQSFATKNISIQIP